MARLAGKVAVITGGSSGIGLATAQRFVVRSTGRIRAASRALRQSYTLPPHTGGVTAAVTGAPSANVLVLTHNGFCPDGRARLWWQLPVHRQLRVRAALFPAAELPQLDQLSPWLERTWTQVDAWVADHTDPG